MPHPASSIIETYTLATDQVVAGGETFRLDKLLVSNNTAAPILVLFQNAADTVTKLAVVVSAWGMVSPQVEGIMDSGCLIKAVSADVYVTMARSFGGA